MNNDKVEHEVRKVDNDHYWIDGRQFVSLERFFSNRSEVAFEYKMIAEEFEKVRKENERLKAVLKDCL